MNSYHLNIAIACEFCRLLLCLGALSYDLESVIILSLYPQESQKERIGEDEFLFADGEFDVNEFFILVYFHNRSFAELLVNNSAL